jgi:cytochrome c553
MMRQLLAFKTGTRASPAGAPMRAIAAALALDDMIAAAAYAGTQPP